MAIEVTVTDTESGESETQTITNDYVIALIMAEHHRVNPPGGKCIRGHETPLGRLVTRHIADAVLASGIVQDAADVRREGRRLLDGIAFTLTGKQGWRHIHRKSGGCAMVGCDCADTDCHGTVCGMQAAIDRHDADVRRAERERVAEEIAAEIEAERPDIGPDVYPHITHESGAVDAFNRRRALNDAARIARALASPDRAATREEERDG